MMILKALLKEKHPGLELSHFGLKEDGENSKAVIDQLIEDLKK